MAEDYMESFWEPQSSFDEGQKKTKVFLWEGDLVYNLFLYLLYCLVQFFWGEQKLSVVVHSG